VAVVGTNATNATNVLGLTLETVVALLTTTEDTAALLELSHTESREFGGSVVLSRIVVHLVDGDGCVDNLGLDNLLVHDWLDSLMDVVVDMLAANRGRCLSALCGTLNDPLILEGSLVSS